MVVKCPHQCWEILAGMVMTDGITGQFPHMLLRVQLWAARREMEGLNMRMLAQIGPYHCTFMPFGTIPQDEQRPSGIDRLQMIEKMTGQLARLLGQCQSALMSRTDIQSAIEMLMVALRSDPHRRRLSPPRPNPRRRRLKIQAHLIDCQNDPFGMILFEVRQLFSKSASKSANCTAPGRER